LTTAQRAYVNHYLNTLLKGLEAEMQPGTERQFVIDMDAVARQQDEPKPDFYYSAEAQQTRYKCDHCGEFNDIRGVFGYCASCGWRNNCQFLRAAFDSLRERLNSRQSGAEDTVRSAVSEFDACCRDLTLQLTNRVPMKRGRQADLERLTFHDVEATAIATLKSLLDIDMLRGMHDDINFIKMMMRRRHLFEHNAGVADARYVAESGDPNAQAGLLIRETQGNAHRFIGCLARIVENFDRDFHEIFPPTQWPIDYHQRRQARRQRP